jgi:hypothetical protein
VGIVRVILDGNDYRALDMEMSARGYMGTIPDDTGATERLYRLPTGTYWRAEPFPLADLRDETRAAVQAIGASGARIIATAGASAWEGLTPLDE